MRAVNTVDLGNHPESVVKQTLKYKYGAKVLQLTIMICTCTSESNNIIKSLIQDGMLFIAPTL